MAGTRSAKYSILAGFWVMPGNTAYDNIMVSLFVNCAIPCGEGLEGCCCWNGNLFLTTS